MVLKSTDIAARLADTQPDSKRLIISPCPNLENLARQGSASLDLRLGTWFVQLKKTRKELLDVDMSTPDLHDELETELSTTYYSPFGEKFVLHPGAFVLGATLEWIRLPCDLAAEVIGKSSLGRQGLIIATATAVHPGFTGCLTLEICNLGEIPISIKAGIPICQLLIHSTQTDTTPIDSTNYAGYRRPVIKRVKMDAIAKKLAAGLK